MHLAENRGAGLGLPPSKASACAPSLRCFFQPPWLLAPLEVDLFWEVCWVGSRIVGGTLEPRWGAVHVPAGQWTLCVLLGDAAVRSGGGLGWGEHTSLQTVSSGSFIPLGFHSSEECLPLHRTKQRFLSRERNNNVFPQCSIPDDFRTQKRESYKTKAGSAGAVVESPGSFLGEDAPSAPVRGRAPFTHAPEKPDFSLVRITPVSD